MQQCWARLVLGWVTNQVLTGQVKRERVSGLTADTSLHPQMAAFGKTPGKASEGRADIWRAKGGRERAEVAASPSRDLV